MRIDAVSATADLIGRRVRMQWTFMPEAGDTIADAPMVTVRRKRRDFAFPSPTTPDPYLVYDSKTFPPAPVPGSLIVADLPDRDFGDGAQRVREETITIADVVAGQAREALRRTVRTVFAADRSVVRQEIELLDVGGPGDALEPGVTYYYELDSPLLATVSDREPYRVTATPGDAYGLNRTLYALIPEIHRRHDTVTRAPDPATGLLPEASVNGGQLRRLVDVFGTALDAMRSSAEGLHGLHDAANVDRSYLPLLARWIGWDLTKAGGIPLQRNEIRNAPRLYEAVGSIPGLRSIVDYYTGWSTRVAEFVQHVALTNVAAQRNVFAIVRRGAEWWGVDDAAPTLGFEPPNVEDVGGGGVAAELVGTTAEPFALRGGMTITIAVDGGLPATITFGEGDFADVGAATAAEVAAVLEAAMGELRADVSAGAVRLRSHRFEDGSRLDVVPARASLVSLDGAPRGRLATATDADGRLWLAHATTVGPGAGSPSRIHVKPHLRGAWYGTQAVDAQAARPQADPALVALSSGPLWLAWVDGPDTATATLRWRLGTPDALTPARVLGDRVEPFALTAGAQLVLTGYGMTETFTVQAGDFAVLGAASAVEVANAINGQLLGVTASPAANGAVQLRTTATGPGVELRVDLASSTTARALGFGDRRLRGHGGWESTVAWGEELAVTPVAAGRHADCTATVDPEQAVRLFWSTQRDRRWRVARVRWDDRILVATGSGVGVRGPGGGAWSSITTADGLPSDDVRGLAVDPDGSTWYATAAGGAVRRPDGTITELSNATTGGGLADDDVRAVAVAADGAVWFAHASGASALDPGGAWQTVTNADGLASNDCRHVTATNDGAVWFATAAGLSRLDANGVWRTWTTAEGLPSDDVRNCAPAPDSTLWAATAAGLAAVAGDGSATAVKLVAAGAPAGADDVRAVAAAPPPRGATTSGVSAATAVGIVELDTSRRARAHGLAEGLPSVDCRAVLVTPDGTAWAGTPAGAAFLPPGDAIWQTLTTADGLPGDDVRALHGPWSAVLEFAPGGAGDRDAHAVLDAANRIWLTWAERQAVGDPSDTWLLRTRRFEWPGPAWTAALALTAVPPAGRVADREPVLAPLTGGGATVSFRSDRIGGPRLWRLAIDVADVVAAPASVTTGEAADTNPAAVAFADGTEWLLFRSDRNLPLSRLGGGVGQGRSDETSRRAPDEASLRRFAGSLTAAPADLDRNRTRRRFGDLLTYTPQKPGGAAEPPLLPDELYTRGTIGLYVERGPVGRPLTQSDVDRLRQLLDRFLPVNLRAVVILRPAPLLFERVYPPGPEDSYSDVYPFVETYTGPTDAAAAALPDWLVLLATDAASLTADPADLTTLQRKTWFTPPE